MSDVDDLLEKFEVTEVGYFGNGKPKLKQDLLNLILKALPKKKQIDKIKYTVDERRHPTGYNQALSDTEEAIRKVLG